MKNKRKRKPPCKWTYEMERKLMAVWKERLVDLQTVTRTSLIYREIATQLEFSSITSEEVHVKIQNMTKRYRRERAKIKSSGGQRSDWAHYKEMNEMLGIFSKNVELVKTEPFDIEDEKPLIDYCESISNSPCHAGEVSQMSTVNNNCSSSNPFVTWTSTIPPASPSSDITILPFRRKKKKHSYKLLDIVKAEFKATRRDSAKMIKLVGGLVDNLSKSIQDQKQFNTELLQLLKSKNYTSDR